MSNITLFQNSSPKNDMNKQLTHLLYGNDNIVPCDIVHPCSIENPVFRLGSDNFDFRHCNYLYCDTFERYYFINDVNVLNNGMVELQCSVDVLKSFEAGILNLYTVVERQEDVKNCNKFIPDPMIVGRLDRQVVKPPKIGDVGGHATGTHIVLTTTGG